MTRFRQFFKKRQTIFEYLSEDPKEQKQHQLESIKYTIDWDQRHLANLNERKQAYLAQRQKILSDIDTIRASLGANPDELKLNRLEELLFKREFFDQNSDYQSILKKIQKTEQRIAELKLQAEVLAEEIASLLPATYQRFDG
jgi:chromosome segregation ATPase